MMMGDIKGPVAWEANRLPNPVELFLRDDWALAPSLAPSDCKPGRRRGTAALDFALAFPIFLLLVFGLIEVGRAMMVISLLNNAARASCREAILPTASPESVNGVVDQMLKSQGVEGYSATVLINNQAAGMTTAVKNDLITVRIKVPFSRVSWIPGLNLVSANLQGQYVLPHE